MVCAMSTKIQPLLSLPPVLTSTVFDFLFPEEIADIVNRVQKSWSAYMSSGVLDLSDLPKLTDRDLDLILWKSSYTYPNKPLTHLFLDNCTQLTSESGERISEIHSLTHLSVVECTNEEGPDVASGLKQMPNLVFLDLSGSIWWKPEVIAQCSSLQELIVKDWCWDEALRALGGLSLEKLDVSNNHTMTIRSVPYINRMTSLQELDISNTLIPPEQVERPGLEVINVVHSDPEPFLNFDNFFPK